MKEKIIHALKWFYQSFIWLFVILLAIDIITKNIIMRTGVTAPGLVADWGFVHISYIQNPNAAFGLGADNPAVSRVIYLVVASLVTAGLIAYLIIKRKETKLLIRAALVMVITGAIGNMIDRIFYEQPNQPLHYVVVDWIDFYWFWPFVFNIADCCIVIAAFMLIIYVIVLEVKDAIARRKAEAGPSVVLSKTEKERLEAEQKAKQDSEKEVDN